MMRWASSVLSACRFAAGKKAGGPAGVGGERQPQGAAVAGLDGIGSALDALNCAAHAHHVLDPDRET
ncbi:MAG: hypothetical protein WAO08_25865 [Hyphomicrobiaceae bacterium]